MNDYRERLRWSGALASFEQARRCNDADEMKRVLESTGFTPLEIESILWSKGEFGAEPTNEEKKQAFRDAVVGRIGLALISGVMLGGVFAYASSGLGRAERTGQHGTDIAMRDFRTPKEAYYRPFMWGFVIGTVGALITGAVVYDPTAKKF
ncbi:MAG: hypothetical protein ABIZ04_23110 [Opitutus sp.]